MKLTAIIDKQKIFYSTVCLLLLTSASAFARRQSGGSGGTDLGVITILAVIGFIALMAFINAGKKPEPLTQEQHQEMSQQAQEFFNRIKATGKMPSIQNTGLVLQPNEFVLLHEPSALIEPRSIRVYGGGGTRIKGVYIGGGESTSVQKLRQVDSGNLSLTTRRIVFDGGMEDRVVNIKDILSVKPWADAIEVSSGKRQKNMVLTVGNPLIWAQLTTMVTSGDVSVVKAGLKLPEKSGGG